MPDTNKGQIALGLGITRLWRDTEPWYMMLTEVWF
jgi:hypothetical protein